MWRQRETWPFCYLTGWDQREKKGNHKLPLRKGNWFPCIWHLSSLNSHWKKRNTKIGKNHELMTYIARNFKSFLREKAGETKMRKPSNLGLTGAIAETAWRAMVGDPRGSPLWTLAWSTKRQGRPLGQFMEDKFKLYNCTKEVDIPSYLSQVRFIYVSIMRITSVLVWPVTSRLPLSRQPRSFFSCPERLGSYSSLSFLHTALASWAWYQCRPKDPHAQKGSTLGS